jgi:PAS domain S-box-containing protein
MSPAPDSGVLGLLSGAELQRPRFDWLRGGIGRANRDVRLLLSIVFIVLLALSAAFVTTREVEHHLLESEATGAAVHWAQFLQAELNGLDDLLAAGLVSEEDRRTLEFAGAAGGVRDYQVIRPDGIVVMSSWSGDFRGTIDPATVMSVIRYEHIVTQVLEQSVAGKRLVVGQAYVPLRSDTGRPGALKVDVDMTLEATRYRRLGNGAFVLLIMLLVPSGGACGWLIHRSFRQRRQSEQLQHERALILEELARGVGLQEVLRQIAEFAQRHYRAGRCAIATFDVTGRRVEDVIAPEGSGLADRAALGNFGGLLPEKTEPLRRNGEAGHHGSTEYGVAQGRIWSISLRATSGALLGGLNLLCARDQDARVAAYGPAGALAQLAALAIEFRRTESALEDIRQRHELILTAAGDGIFGVDADEHIVFVNPAAARMLGSVAEAMIGRPAGALFVTDQRDQDDPAQVEDDPIAVTLREGRGRHVEQVALHRDDGGTFPAAVMVSPVRRRASNLRAVVVFHDISAQIHAREQLRRAKEEAESANRAKSSFLASMSHELRTPLNAIIGFSEVMVSQLLGPIGNAHYHEYVADIHASGVHLLSLINDLLDLSKIESGKVDLREETVNLPALLQRCVVFVSEPVRARSLALDVEIAVGLAEVRCDERKLKQVIVNLLSNAVKFTPAGGRIVLSAVCDGGNDLRIDVVDDGIGISAEHIERVLEPFAQVDNVNGGESGGTGLGLPIARQLIELHGGTLSLSSEPDVGTTVTIRLPARIVVPTEGSQARSLLTA